MKRLLILSGKGGTGKTTTAAAFLHFSHAEAAADCDVDAPNLHLVSKMKAEPESSIFYGSDKAVIDPELCIGCGACVRHCRFHAIQQEDTVCKVIDYACEGCGVCAHICPKKAVALHQDEAGTKTLYQGAPVFSTAMLKMGRGNSGKLVTEVKVAMLEAAPKEGLAIIDGSPGIGCPVIASVSGVDLVLIVAEPSLSGASDLERLLRTASILQTKVSVCVNKYDTSPQQTKAIETLCAEHQVPFLGKIPYDKHVAQAINEGASVAEYDCPAKEALYHVYQGAMSILNGRT